MSSVLILATYYLQLPPKPFSQQEEEEEEEEEGDYEGEDKHRRGDEENGVRQGTSPPHS
jgi:hypothetical protein